MDAKLLSKAGFAHWEPKCPLDLAIAYEDSSTRRRALALYDHLSHDLLDEYDFQCSWWKLDCLESSILMEEASDAAARATMVILALKNGQDLSPTTRKWIETWISRKEDRKSALVVVVDETQSSQPPPVQHICQNYARRAAMDFFFHSTETHEEPKYSSELISRKAKTVGPLMEEILHRRTPDTRWLLM